MEQRGQPRTGTYQPRHKKNPYQTTQQDYHTTIFAPDTYTLNLILGLPARALRVLLMLAARLDPITGMSHCTRQEMKTMLSGKPCNISHAIGELVDADLVARGTHLNTYYLNHNAFTPIHFRF